MEKLTDDSPQHILPHMRLLHVYAICPHCGQSLATMAYSNKEKLLTHLPVCPCCCTDIRTLAWQPAPEKV